MAEIKFLTEEVAAKIEDDSLGGRGGGGEKGKGDKRKPAGPHPAR